MAETFDEWAILELMGHRKLAGRVTEQVIAGAGFVRIDICTDAEKAVLTQFYGPSAVYCITPTVEADARAYARRNIPRPVEPWEVRSPLVERQPDLLPQDAYEDEPLSEENEEEEQQERRAHDRTVRLALPPANITRIPEDVHHTSHAGELDR